MSVHKTIGIMSGTSLDGIDIAYCTFKKKTRWTYKIDKAITVKFPKIIKKRLLKSFEIKGYELIKLDHDLGDFIGNETKKFIKRNNFSPEIIACHGHTIFHNLKDKISFQIGNANRIYSKLEIPIINNFRELDVIFDGQGAPLVPIGEKLLFNKFNYFVNLGGVLNLTKLKGKEIIAYDIAPLNIILNDISRKLNYDFDDKGNIAKNGKFISKLFNELNSLDYYKKPNPKSLGIEWIQNKIYPLIYKSGYNLEDLLNTLTNHIAFQLSLNIKERGNNILVTGGGAYNKFLIENIRLYDKNKNNWKIPNKTLINYKEALIFAFMGLLRKRKEKNILQSVTGSTVKLSSGIITENIIFNKKI